MKSGVAGVSSGAVPASRLLVAAVAVLMTSGCAGSRPGPAERRAPPDHAFRDCPHCPVMVMIPAGSFLMGSPETEEGREGDEGPQREITVRAPFAIGVYEVTFEEWDACVSDGGCDGYRPPDWWGRGRQPVTEVSWRDARAYVEWLSKETGLSYSLPNEAQREYAARAGTRTARYWGESAEEQCRYANGFDRVLARTNRNGLAMFEEYGLTFPRCADGQGDGTAPVGSYEPNAFGLHDMIGNLTFPAT